VPVHKRLQMFGQRGPGDGMREGAVRAGVFADLDSGDRGAFIRHLKPAVFARGRTIFSQGHTAGDVYLIDEGKVKLTRTSPEGRTRLIEVLGPGDVFGELAVVDGGPRSFTATTLAETHAAMISKTDLDALMTERPEVARRLLRLLAARLRRTNDLLSDQTHVDVAGRLAKQLLYLAQRFGTTEGTTLRVNHELTQTELAHLVGSTRESVNSALVDFTQRGWIRAAGKGIIICDSERLAHRANGAN
jgi:CRP/FNR family cyclic AMP-dependent transcriptional regulator